MFRLARMSGLQAVLVAAVAIVWGLVVIQLYRGIHGSEEVAVTNSDEPRRNEVSPPARRLGFIGDFRDPFGVTTMNMGENSDDTDDYYDEWHFETLRRDPPPWTLTGVIGRTAILQPPGAQPFLASEGAVIDGVEITVVERDHAVLHVDGASFTLLLRGDPVAAQSYTQEPDYYD